MPSRERGKGSSSFARSQNGLPPAAARELARRGRRARAEIPFGARQKSVGNWPREGEKRSMRILNIVVRCCRTLHDPALRPSAAPFSGSQLRSFGSHSGLLGRLLPAPSWWAFFPSSEDVYCCGVAADGLGWPGAWFVKPVNRTMQGTVVVITGATSGIGQVAAESLGRREDSAVSGFRTGDRRRTRRRLRPMPSPSALPAGARPERCRTAVG